VLAATVTSAGRVLGTLDATTPTPRDWTDADAAAAGALAREVIAARPG
jgi:GAF domain-containing protein